MKIDEEKGISTKTYGTHKNKTFIVKLITQIITEHRRNVNTMSKNTSGFEYTNTRSEEDIDSEVT